MHLLPCNIKYSGPAKVDIYFEPKIVEEQGKIYLNFCSLFRSFKK